MVRAKSNKGKTCIFPECSRKRVAIGLCAQHRTQQRQGKELMPLDRICSWPGCETVVSKGNQSRCKEHKSICSYIVNGEPCGLIAKDGSATCINHIFSRLRPFGPRAPGPWRIGSEGYVYRKVTVDGVAYHQKQHRIELGRKIGRTLLDTESPHHKNGVRHDNSWDNLELWVVPQRKGIRGVDALAWAKRIIETLEPIEDKL